MIVYIMSGTNERYLNYDDYLQNKRDWAAKNYSVMHILVKLCDPLISYYRAAIQTGIHVITPYKKLTQYPKIVGQIYKHILWYARIRIFKFPNCAKYFQCFPCKVIKYTILYMNIGNYYYKYAISYTRI